MTRLYLKIFVSFWLITIMMIVGTSLVVHWFDLGADKHLGHRGDKSIPSEMRFLKQVVRQAINHDLENVRFGLGTLPPWAIRYLYIVDSKNLDLLGRNLPPHITDFLPRLDNTRPFARQQTGPGHIYGRYLTLTDGQPIKVVTVTHQDGNNTFWQLFFYNVWPTLLVSIFISGTACLFLAKRMSRGFSALKRATQEIATGDLSVRVSSHFQGKHDEISLLGMEFDKMAERLEKAMQEQKRLVKDVSHELRSPLARLQVALALAQQRSNGDVDHELNRIKEAAEYLNNIISDILSLPLNENETWELNDTLDLKSLLETLIANHLDEASSKNVQLNLTTRITDALVPTHGNTLTSVFENLLRNALHYTSPDSQITVRLTEYHHGKNHSGDIQSGHFRIDIEDQGSGVPEDNLEDIFQPFYRTDEARDRTSGGYGLGLAIAQRTVALHRGSIKAKNHAAGGLIITVILPRSEFS